MRTQRPGDEFSGLGLSIQQGIILKLLLADGEMTQKDLTEKLQITSSSCGALLAKLEQGGYIERQAHSNDKRTFAVTLTDDGRKLGKQYKETSVEVLEKWSDFLTQEEKEQLIALLTKLYDGLENRVNENK
jgi:DNA-binding MarR family transcriptional regulator